MKHKVFGKKFSRTTKQRKALFLGLCRSLIKNGEITTTLSKAKAARSFTERLITIAKKGDLASRRQLHKILREVSFVNQLVEEIAPAFKNRTGGYLRIIKLEQRKGDAAPMAKIVFVEKVEKSEISLPASKVNVNEIKIPQAKIGNKIVTGKDTVKKEKNVKS